MVPFYHAVLPFATFLGVTASGRWPDPTAWADIALICGAELFLLATGSARRRA
jgi:hypothetical protein